MTSVIPLPFQGDLIDYLKLDGREIAWLWRDGEAFIPVRPICDILGVSYSRQRKVLTAPGSEATVALWATVGADGKDREMLCLAFPDFLPWLMGISPSRVSEDAREPLRALRSEIKLVLAAHYHDRLLGEGREAVAQLQGFLTDYVTARPIRGKVARAVDAGWSWQMLVGTTSYTQKRLLATIRELLRIGAIPHAPEGTPLEDGSRQMDLFADA